MTTQSHALKRMLSWEIGEEVTLSFYNHILLTPELNQLIKEDDFYGKSKQDRILILVLIK